MLAKAKGSRPFLVLQVFTGDTKVARLWVPCKRFTSWSLECVVSPLLSKEPALQKREKVFDDSALSPKGG